MKRIVALIAAGLLASGDSMSGAELASNDLVYEIDRYSLMLDRTLELGARDEEHPEAPRESARSLMVEMQSAVLQYNYARFENCRRGYLRKISCGEPWRPAWLSEPPSAATSLAVVQARSDEVSKHVEAYWDAACEDARDRLSHEIWQPYCSIE